MLPKEKAQELVHKFKYYVHGYSEKNLSQAKTVARMVVDEILSEVAHGKRLDWIQERKDGQEYIVYWTQVKTEIDHVSNL